LRPNDQEVEASLDHAVLHLDAMQSFWKCAYGWAPREAAELLEKSRLDRVVTLAIRDRSVGTTAEFRAAILKLKALVNELDSRLLYPDEGGYCWVDPDEAALWE